MTVDIASVTNAIEAGTQQVTSTIVDDDPPPKVTGLLANWGVAVGQGRIVDEGALLDGAAPSRLQDLWLYADDLNYHLMNQQTTTGIIVCDLAGSGQGDLVAGFKDLGVWRRQANGAWVKLVKSRTMGPPGVNASPYPSAGYLAHGGRNRDLRSGSGLFAA